MRHLVVREIEGPSGVKHLPGSEVDATGWRLEQLLVEQRKLAPIPSRAPTKKELARPNPTAARLKAHLAPPKVGKQPTMKEKV